MKKSFSLSQFLTVFSDDDSCLAEVTRMRYPNGIYCRKCKRITKHYHLKDRTAYSCKECRRQIYPLSGTIFEKTTTSLRDWLYCMFLMTQAHGDISAKQLQRELGVTYKTAWRMRKSIYTLMTQNNGDLLKKPEENIRKWIFFNKIEFTIVQRQNEK